MSDSNEKNTFANSFNVIQTSMKKITLFVIIMAFVSGLSAQEYIPFPPDSTSVWRIDEQWWSPDPFEITTWNRLIFQDGQTVFMGKVYNNFFSSGDVTTYWSNGTTTTNTFSHSVYRSLRTEGSKVYVLESGVEYVLFDYEIQAGDTVPDDFYIWTYCEYQNPLVVSSIDSVLIGNRYHKRYNFPDPGMNGTISWFIEGIGHDFGIVESACVTPDHGSNFVCYAENGESLLQIGDICDLTVDITEIQPTDFAIIVSPNPTTGLISLEFQSQREMQISVQILDMAGRNFKADSWQINPNMNTKYLDLSGLKNGIYLIIFNENNGENVSRQRIVLCR